MAISIDPRVLRTVFLYRDGALYRRDLHDPTLVFYLQPGDYICPRAVIPPTHLHHLPPNLPERLSVKQVIYAMHHGCIPRYILPRDGVAQNLTVENLEGTDKSPRWRGHKPKQVPCRYDAVTKQIVPLSELPPSAATNNSFYARKKATQSDNKT